MPCNVNAFTMFSNESGDHSQIVIKAELILHTRKGCRRPHGGVQALEKLWLKHLFMGSGKVLWAHGALQSAQKPEWRVSSPARPGKWSQLPAVKNRDVAALKTCLSSTSRMWSSFDFNSKGAIELHLTFSQNQRIIYSESWRLHPWEEKECCFFYLANLSSNTMCIAVYHYIII